MVAIIAGSNAVIQAQFTPMTAIARETAPVRRLGPRAFWLLFAIEALLFGALLIALTNTLLPARTPLSAPEPGILRAAVLTQLDGSFDDPLIEAAPGAIARSSNIRGFQLGGEVYYYYFEGQRSFDPLTRGIIAHDQIEIVLRDSSGPQTLVIYRILA